MNFADASAMLTLSAPGVAGVTVDVAVSDDDTLSILVSPSAVRINEGDAATLNYSLSHDPLGTVDVRIGSSDERVATVDSASLRFDSSNYNQAQPVMVSTSFDDDVSDEAATMSAAIPLDTPTQLVQAPGIDTNAVLVTTQPGTYLFELEVMDPARPVVTVSLATPTPLPVDLYVRGSFNGFSTADPMTFDGEAGYLAYVFLPAGIQELKIADALFTQATTFSVDPAVSAPILLDTPTWLAQAPGTGNNTTLTIATPGLYRFELQVRRLETPVLTITLLP